MEGNPGYEILYAGLVHDMHHGVGSHLATIEGLFLIAVEKDHPQYQLFKTIFEELKKDKVRITDRYNKLEEYINSKS